MSERQHMLGYVRVSTEEQTESGLGLEAQVEAIHDAAERRGWTVDILADAGCSGKQVNPELRRGLDLLVAGRADGLVVTKMDRLARSVAHAAEIIDMAKAQGWNLVTLNIGLDLTTPTGRAMAHMLATFAELEREMIRSRIKDAFAAKKRRGEPVGRPRLAPAGVVRRIVLERDSGASFRGIARGLTADRILSPAGRPTWQESSVRRLYASATRAAVAS